jgi:hypothetical protein
MDEKITNGRRKTWPFITHECPIYCYAVVCHPCHFDLYLASRLRKVTMSGKKSCANDPDTATQRDRETARVRIILSNTSSASIPLCCLERVQLHISAFQGPRGRGRQNHNQRAVPRLSAKAVLTLIEGYSLSIIIDLQMMVITAKSYNRENTMKHRLC